MQILIKTITEKIIILNVEPNNTLNDIKKMIEYKENIPTSKQYFIFGGKKLADDKMLSDYLICNNSYIQVIGRIYGGK